MVADLPFGRLPGGIDDMQPGDRRDKALNELDEILTHDLSSAMASALNAEAHSGGSADRWRNLGAILRRAALLADTLAESD